MSVGRSAGKATSCALTTPPGPENLTTIAARAAGAPSLGLRRLAHAELAQVLQVLLAPGRPLHREEMLEPADEQRPAAEVHADRLACEGRIRRVLVDPGDPLHDVERP
jgi:hypothetical protein